jgi:outer membrane protein OmpA-like peptidoglycan-associated protein
MNALLMKAALMAAVLMASGCANQASPAGSAPAVAALDSSALELKRVALESANQSSGISVLRTQDDQLQVNFPSDFSFATDSDDISANMRPLLDHLAADLARPDLSSLQILIVGFTDSDGAESANRALSLARANSVRKYLENKGLPASRLSVEGRGEASPQAGNDKKYGRALNRRIEIYLREPG